jgi:hypothetical protein
MSQKKAWVLEIIAGVAMHDPGLIRRHCLEFHSFTKRSQNHQHQDRDRDVAGLGRPEANEKKQVIFLCPPNDLLAAVLFLLDAETDAGYFLQVSEIMKFILDTDMMGEHPVGLVLPMKQSTQASLMKQKVFHQAMAAIFSPSLMNSTAR